MNTPQTSTKLAHIDACLYHDVAYKKSAGFDRYDFINEAASELSLSEIDLSQKFLGKTVKAPLMIAPMTGGIERGQFFNQLWATAAEKYGLAMGVGSQRLAIEDPKRVDYYAIRRYAPNTVLFANVGAGQIAKGYGPDEIKRAVDMLEADAVFIHFNAIQEVIQKGDTSLKGVLKRLSLICKSLSTQSVPVFAREVSFGLSANAALRLMEAGVSGLDCAGAGGTSWSKVEAICATDPNQKRLGLCFAEWGIPTAESLVAVQKVASRLPLIATGGIESGLDVGKALALGAHLAAQARPLLLAAHQGEEVLHRHIETTLEELKICMFGIGASSLKELRLTPNLVPNPRRNL